MADSDNTKPGDDSTEPANDAKPGAAPAGAKNVARAFATAPRATDFTEADEKRLAEAAERSERNARIAAEEAARVKAPRSPGEKNRATAAASLVRASRPRAVAHGNEARALVKRDASGKAVDPRMAKGPADARVRAVQASRRVVGQAKPKPKPAE